MATDPSYRETLAQSVHAVLANCQPCGHLSHILMDQHSSTQSEETIGPLVSGTAISQEQIREYYMVLAQRMQEQRAIARPPKKPSLGIILYYFPHNLGHVTAYYNVQITTKHNIKLQ